MTGQFLFLSFGGLALLISPLWPIGALAFCVGMAGLCWLLVAPVFK